MLVKLLLLLPLVVPPQSLASYVNHKRVLLLFGAGPTDGQVERQNALLTSHSEALKERDVVVVRDLRAGNNPGPDALRAQYHIADAEFTVILIGKDGDEKMRLHTPITVEKLSAIIDAMPMRRDEMRGRK